MLLEFTSSGPGPLFKRVMEDQFTRIRDADRFWFENKEQSYVITYSVFLTWKFSKFPHKNIRIILPIFVLISGKIIRIP